MRLDWRADWHVYILPKIFPSKGEICMLILKRGTFSSREASLLNPGTNAKVTCSKLLAWKTSLSRVINISCYCAWQAASKWR